MKILHISDVHIDITATVLGKSKVVNEVYQKRLELLNYLIEISLDNEVDHIVISGDLFNKPKPYPQEYHDLNKVLLPAKSKLLIINGNHDEMTQRGCGLQPLQAMGYYTFMNFNHVEPFIFAPWGTDFNLISELCDVTRYKPILIYHCGVWSKDAHWVELDGESGNVSLEQLESLGCQAILLGHHHNQTELALGIWYAGSPEIFTFGEENDTKGALMWTIEGKNDVEVTPISTNHLRPPWKTFKPDEFLEYGNEFDGYVRVMGEVDDKDRLHVIKKINSFKCLDYKLDLKNKVKNNRVFQLKGKTDAQVLENYFKQKGIKNYKELIKLDKEINV